MGVMWKHRKTEVIPRKDFSFGKIHTSSIWKTNILLNLPQRQPKISWTDKKENEIKKSRLQIRIHIFLLTKTEKDII